MKKLLIFHPFLFTVFPILFLYTHNKALTTVDKVIAPLLTAILFAILLFYGANI